LASPWPSAESESLSFPPKYLSNGHLRSFHLAWKLSILSDQTKPESRGFEVLTPLQLIGEEPDGGKSVVL
jgi:hypothetical protein